MVAMVRAFRANEKICLIFSELTVDRGHVKVAKSFVTLTIRCYAMLFSWRQIFLMGNHLARIKSFFLQHPDAMRRLLLSLSLSLCLRTNTKTIISAVLHSLIHTNVHHGSDGIKPLVSKDLFTIFHLSWWLCHWNGLWGSWAVAHKHTAPVQVFISFKCSLIIYRCVCLSLPININFCAEWNISTLR